jgi:hypothetical protein
MGVVGSLVDGMAVYPGSKDGLGGVYAAGWGINQITNSYFHNMLNL